MERDHSLYGDSETAKGTTGNGTLAGTWKELAVCWVKLEEESHMYAQRRVHGAWRNMMLHVCPDGAVWMDRTACRTLQKNLWGNPPVFQHEEMRNFHDLLKQKPCSLFMFLGWTNLIQPI
jgi:hypothetical protein